VIDKQAIQSADARDSRSDSNSSFISVTRCPSLLLASAANCGSGAAGTSAPSAPDADGLRAAGAGLDDAAAAASECGGVQAAADGLTAPETCSVCTAALARE
jgi:hypothetical protein